VGGSGLKNPTKGTVQCWQAVLNSMCVIGATHEHLALARALPKRTFVLLPPYLQEPPSSLGPGFAPGDQFPGPGYVRYLLPLPGPIPGTAIPSALLPYWPGSRSGPELVPVADVSQPPQCSPLPPFLSPLRCCSRLPAACYEIETKYE
jgi:hypothetical protein